MVGVERERSYFDGIGYSKRQAVFLVLLVAAIARSDLGFIMGAVGLTFAPQIAAAISSSVTRLRAAAFIEAEPGLSDGLVEEPPVLFVHRSSWTTPSTLPSSTQSEKDVGGNERASHECGFETGCVRAR